MNFTAMSRRPGQDLKIGDDCTPSPSSTRPAMKSLAGNQPYLAVGSCAVAGGHSKWLKACRREPSTGSADVTLHGQPR